LVPKPRFYDRVRETPLLERRTAIILDRMYQVQVP
jgi:membrane peptidoglycan carboxypeptidase